MEMNLVLGGICIIGGLLTIIFGLLQAQKAKKASQTWSTAEGEILDSHLQKHKNRSSRGVSVTTYSPEVSYRYTVNGQVYTGNKFGFGSGTFAEKKANEKIAPYAAGTKATVHYDPAEPSKAVLETTATSKGSAVLLGGMLIVLGIIVFIVL